MDCEKSRLIHEVGSVLARLANQNGGILLQNLLKDYQSVNGKVFPLRKMGHVNPVKAIEAMGEHVKIIEDKRLGVKRIVCVKQDAHNTPSNHNRKPLRTIQPPNPDFRIPCFSEPPPSRINFQRPPPAINPPIPLQINRSIPPPIDPNIPLVISPCIPPPMDPSIPPPMDPSVPPLMDPSVPPPNFYKTPTFPPSNFQAPPIGRHHARPSSPHINLRTPPLSAQTSPEPEADNIGDKHKVPPKNLSTPPPNAQTSNPEPETIKSEKVKRKRNKKSRMVPQRMTYQLTFVNQYQLEKLEIVDVFEKFGELVRVSVFSGIKRRCFIHYKNEENAIAALDALKDDDQYYDLEIADACKREPTESDDEDECSDGDEETDKKPIDMVIHRGTYQLSFSTENYVRIEAISDMFSEFGTVAGVDCNYRRVKGRARVFVKFHDKTCALTAYNQLKDQFEDLEVAKSCMKPEVDDKEKVPVGPDGKYCLRFRNFGPGNGLFANWEVRDMFSQFGEVVSVRQDDMQWCYIRYNKQDEAQAAYDEYKFSTILDSFGVAKCKDQVDDPAEVEEEQSDMELFISNYPHAMTLKNLKRIFRDHKLQFRRMRVSEQKAYCFAKVGTLEEMKAVIKDLNGLDIRGRRLVVRAKIQEMHEAIEEELRAEEEQMKEQQVKGWDDWNETALYEDQSTEVKVIIAGYPEGTTEGEMRRLLSPYGPVKIFMGDPEEEEFTYSHIIFGNMKSATRAVHDLDGISFGSSEQIVVEFVDS